MGSAPVLGDVTPGGLVAMFRACLINGFGAQTPTTVTYSGGKITATFSGAHGFLPYQIVNITGVNESGYNGDQRIDSTTSTTITITPQTAPTVTPATGTISIKTPPLDGWSETYYDAGTHNIVFSRTNVNATDYKIRIYNDISYSTNTTYGNWVAKVDVITNWTNITTYTLQQTAYFPGSARYATSQEWVVMGDDLMFVWLNRFAANSRTSAYIFGDINSVVGGDRHHCIVLGCSNDGAARWNTSGAYATHSNLGTFKSTYQRWLMRNYGAVGGILTGSGITTGTGSVVWDLRGYFEARFGQYVTYPNPVNNGLMVFKGPLMITETNNVRGYMPGLMQPLSEPITILHNTILTTLPGLEGIPVLLYKVSYSTNNDAAETLGAWRLDNWRIA